MLEREGIRQPDVSEGESYGVWYGAEGVESDCATEVTHIGAGWWEVSSYQHVEGYFDTYDPEHPFLQQSIVVEADDMFDAFAEGVNELAETGGEEKMVESLPE